VVGVQEVQESPEPSDGQLLDLCRTGDRQAFSELWRRHSAVAVRYARSLGTPPDAEDVVSDAFLNILRLLRIGKGPEGRLRPYLLTTVKNTWLSVAQRAPAAVDPAVLDEEPSSRGVIDVEHDADESLVSEAFHSLPDRWQQALWLNEVERLPPRQIATILGIRPNAVAALTYRAREALRRAWINMDMVWVGVMALAGFMTLGYAAWSASS